MTVTCEVSGLDVCLLNWDIQIINSVSKVVWHIRSQTGGEFEMHRQDMTTDLTFITNEKNQTLKSRLPVLIKDALV